MPTKQNWAGEQQEYYPAGSSKGGEYAAGSGLGGKKFDGEVEHDFNNPNERESNFLVEHEFDEPGGEDKLITKFREETINNKLSKIKSKGETQIDNINLDLSKPISKITDQERNITYLDYPKEYVDLATEKIRRYEPIVDNIANDILGSTESQGGLMIGLDFRLKRLGSLSRKIDSDITEAKEKGITLTPQQAVEKMGDVARFTACFDPKNFKKGADKVIRDLQAKGYELIKFKNYFQPGASYKGLNCNFKDKQGNIFELQFHTPESMKVKEGYNIDIKNRKATVDKAAFQSHDVYETTRLLEDKVRKGIATYNEQDKLKRLKDYNIKMWDSIQYSFPDWTIDNYNKKGTQ